MSTEKQAPELSKEELAERRVEITTFYKENIKHLKVQKEYEELLRDVEKARVERLQAQMFLAQAYAAQEEGGKKPEAAQEFEKEMAKTRTLKKS
jgi:hypothetical protein|tara:strand:- start:8137 stop:8418 length:282 start_codon:yes stop_codon:yes gene_type:complete